MLKNFLALPMKYALITALFSVYPSFAQSKDTLLNLSAEQAVRMAMKNNHTLKSLHHQLNQTQYSVKSAATNFLPNVSLSGSYNRTETEESSGINNDNPIYGAIAGMLSPSENSYKLGLQIQQPIFTGFATINGLRSAQLSSAIQKVSNETVQQKMRYAILQVYWGIVSLQKSKTVASEAIRQLEELTSNQQARMEQGMATEHDYLLTKASLAQARMSELKVNKSISSMKREFAVLLGLPATSQISLSDTSTGDSSLKVNLDSAVNTTLMQRSDLKQSQLNINMAELGMKSAKSALYPAIMAGFSYSNSSSDLFEREQWNYNWSAYVSLNFNLLDWGDRIYKIKKAKELQLAMDEIYKEKKETVHKEILDAYHELEQTRNELETSKLLVEAREKAYSASIAKHEEGVIPMYELLDAHNSFISAKYEVLQAATNLELAIANLNMGGLGASR